MPKIFFVSGLGADSRAFTLLTDFNGFESIFLEWIPNQPNESLANYTQRLFSNHQPTESDVVLGLSYGGLVTIEASKLFPVQNIILLSSLRDSYDLKPILQFLLQLRLYNLILNIKSKTMDRLALQFFSITLNPQAKKLFYNFICFTV